MRARTILLTLLLGLLGVIAVGQVLTPAPPSTPEAASVIVIVATPVVAPTPTAKPTPTATPGPLTSFAINAADQADSVNTFGFALLKLLATALGLYVIYKFIRLLFFRSPELVVENFSNASGDATLDTTLPGFSLLLREKLVKEIKRVREYMHETPRLGMKLPFSPDFSLDKEPLLSGTPDQRLDDLVSSLSEFAPKEVKPALPLIKFAFPGRITRVASMLQYRGGAPGELGITFEVTDTAIRQAPRVYTFWEPLAKNVAAANSPATAPAQSTNTGLRQQPQSYVNIAALLERVGLFSDAIDYLKEALKLDKTLKEATRALEASVCKLQVQESGTAAYVAGKKL